MAFQIERLTENPAGCRKTAPILEWFTIMNFQNIYIKEKVLQSCRENYSFHTKDQDTDRF